MIRFQVLYKGMRVKCVKVKMCKGKKFYKGKNVKLYEGKNI